MLASVNGKDLWYLSRGSGLVLLVIFTVVFVLGIAARTGAGPKRWDRFVTQGLHRTLSLFAVALLALHVLTAILDPFVSIGWLSIVVPFASAYRTLWIGLGTLAVDFGGAIIITSLLRRHLGYRSWRAAHWLAYAAWPVAFVHSLRAGSDLSVGWVAAIVWGCAAAFAVAVGARLLGTVRDDDPGATDDATRTGTRPSSKPRRSSTVGSPRFRIPPGAVPIPVLADEQNRRTR
jgi:sulfoxide reductase heme-binding subunit YedZ